MPVIDGRSNRVAAYVVLVVDFQFNLILAHCNKILSYYVSRRRIDSESKKVVKRDGSKVLMIIDGKKILQI